MGAVQAEWKAGWRFVLAAGIGSATGLILYPYVASLFIKQFVAEFGWTRGEISLAGFATLSAGLLAPFIGRLADGVGVRPVILIGAAGFALACLGMALQPGDIRIYYGLVFCLVLFGLGTSSITWTRVVNGAFEKSRGTALSVALSAVTLTAAAMPPALNAVITAYGWRAGWVLLGAVAIVFAIVALLSLPRAKPEAEPAALAPGGAQKLGDAAKTKAFWLLVIGMFLINIPSGGLMNQMAALVSDKGFKGAEIALVMSSFAISVFVGRLIAGVCMDRFPAPLVAFIATALPAAGCLMLLGQGNYVPLVIAGIVLAGLSQGAEGDIGPYMIARRFGLTAFGAIMGSVNAAVVVGTAMGAMLFGQTHDRTGSYDLALWIGAGAFVIGALCFLAISLGPPREESLPRTAPQPA